MNVGYKIRTLRERKGISPKDFSHQLDIDLSTLNRIENGKTTSFKPDFLMKVCAVLKLNISELFEQNNAPTAIQHTEQGNNINVLHQQDRSEKTQVLYEDLLKTKNDLVQSLKQQLEILLHSKHTSE